MPEEEKDVVTTEEDKEVVVEEQEPKSEENDESEKEDGFVKSDEVVEGNKYNQALRKAREAEMEKRELEKQLSEKKVVTSPEKEEEKEEEDDLFEEKKEVDIESLVDAKVKPVLERLNQKEAEEKKNQRTAFFEEHPEYLKNSEKWQELLDEVDNFNPNSKDGYYKQLIKAHRIISAEEVYSDIDKKKKDMASESASKGDGSQKAADKKSSEENREDRLAKKMPVGFEYK